MPDDMSFSDERVYAPNSSYLNPPLKDGAVLVWTDANMSPVRPVDVELRVGMLTCVLCAGGEAVDGEAVRHRPVRHFGYRLPDGRGDARQEACEGGGLLVTRCPFIATTLHIVGARGAQDRHCTLSCPRFRLSRLSLYGAMQGEV